MERRIGTWGTYERGAAVVPTGDDDHQNIGWSSSPSSVTGFACGTAKAINGKFFGYFSTRFLVDLGTLHIDDLVPITKIFRSKPERF